MAYQLVQKKLSLLGKEGVATPDADGYYTLVIGALNAANNSGAWFYVAEGARQLFESSSLLQRRCANGALMSEVTHPVPRPGETEDAFTARFMDIDPRNTCAHIRKVWLDEDFGKKNPVYKNPSMVAIMGEVKPDGPHAKILESALTNKHRNACFSIRGFAREFMQGGRVHRELTQIFDFDFVTEGGIPVASKWDSPATESADNSDIILPVTRQILARISEKSSSQSLVQATETSRFAAEYLLDRYMKPESSPIYTRW